MSAESNLQNASQWKEYCNLELIPTKKNDRSVSRIQSILSLIENLWQNAIASLTEESELNKWQGKDGDNHIHWHEYDPWTSECFLRDRFFRNQCNDCNNLNH